MSFENEITRWQSVRTDYVRVGYKHKVGFCCQRARGETGGKIPRINSMNRSVLAAQMYHNEPLAMKGFESIFSRT